MSGCMLQKLSKKGALSHCDYHDLDTRALALPFRLLRRPVPAPLLKLNFSLCFPLMLGSPM